MSNRSFESQNERMRDMLNELQALAHRFEQYDCRHQAEYTRKLATRITELDGEAQTHRSAEN